jgi:hypothetical protein
VSRITSQGKAFRKSCATTSRLPAARSGNAFRTPGGFANGLDGREDLQRMLLDLGFNWISSRYPAHATSKPGGIPMPDVFESIVKAQDAAQPYVYPTGLVEIPMSPISDIVEHQAVFDFLGHPACLNVVDPEFKSIDLICELVRKSNGKAELATLDQIAGSLEKATKPNR